MSERVIIIRERSAVVAYVLWFFLGHFGVHRFYLGRIGSGVCQLALFLIGGATVWFLIGLIPLGILWLWLFLDIFLIPGMTRSEERRLAG